MFDASAKHEGISLDDQIYQGPKLQNELFNVLLMFRMYPIGLICVTAEMYLRIGLKKNDRHFTGYKVKKVIDIIKFEKHFLNSTTDTQS